MHEQPELIDFKGLNHIICIALFNPSGAVVFHHF